MHYYYCLHVVKMYFMRLFVPRIARMIYRILIGARKVASETSVSTLNEFIRSHNCTQRPLIISPWSIKHVNNDYEIMF